MLEVPDDYLVLLSHKWRYPSRLVGFCLFIAWSGCGGISDARALQIVFHGIYDCTVIGKLLVIFYFLVDVRIPATGCLTTTWIC